ncbi:hypothetical protein M0R19_06355 [Candidatus Pacearchaeota archaeon]|jgi:hypothetical protein|nr:hypothetical protein [Candidatus Pacearchaeota archaeon]
MIDLKVKRGAGDRPIGTIQVENLTTEAEALLYGEKEINDQWVMVDKIGISQEECIIADPFDCVNVNSNQRGWIGKTLFLSSISLTIDENNICTTNAECEDYINFED